ncbi:hypothetical protein FA13DRAFT_1797287 [Coprinellus micaceus]|uniref:Uncharacterized protein n=1 Tax=Coprinellus micaceus TaxID=71717 RepID=A0A4Y7ST34_COPMI|nr:hypothetical protein FA13DRAFT_1797287 [Coprinellus micaceus]
MKVSVKTEEVSTMPPNTTIERTEPQGVYAQVGNPLPVEPEETKVKLEAVAYFVASTPAHNTVDRNTSPPPCTPANQYPPPSLLSPRRKASQVAQARNQELLVGGMLDTQQTDTQLFGTPGRYKSPLGGVFPSESDDWAGSSTPFQSQQACTKDRLAQFVTDGVLTPNQARSLRLPGETPSPTRRKPIPAPVFKPITLPVPIAKVLVPCIPCDSPEPVTLANIPAVTPPRSSQMHAPATVPRVSLSLKVESEQEAKAMELFQSCLHERTFTWSSLVNQARKDAAELETKRKELEEALAVAQATAAEAEDARQKLEVEVVDLEKENLRIRVQMERLETETGQLRTRLLAVAAFAHQEVESSAKRRKF